VPQNSLFSTYRQGENRVTASMLAVFERIGTDLTGRILGSASLDSSLQFVTFINQVPGQQKSVPDASIEANFRYLFEVKTARNAVDSKQTINHLNLLQLGTDRLFVLTPDAERPSGMAQITDQRAVWLNFQSLSQAIDDLLGDSLAFVSEQTRFLLRELQALFAQDGLLSPHDDTVVVAARWAYPIYHAYGAYIFQARRRFRDGVMHLAFYADSVIKPEVPRILYRQDDVIISLETVQQLRASGQSSEIKARLAALIESLLFDKIIGEGSVNQIFLLSKISEGQTIILDKPIRNTARDRNGDPCAFTMGQPRYTRVKNLQSVAQKPAEAATTGELDKIKASR